MKKILGVFLAICILAAVIEGLKPDGANTQNIQKNQSTTNSTQAYPNQYLYQHNSSPVTYPCSLCNGTGKIQCRVCNGTGKNSDYENLSSVMKGFSKPYCEGCDGNGWITCGRCHGTGQD